MLTLNVNLFDYNKETKTLSAEASTLEAHSKFTGQREFVLKNYKTGGELVVRFSHHEMDASFEDVISYIYKPVDSTVINEVEIYND